VPLGVEVAGGDEVVVLPPAASPFAQEARGSHDDLRHPATALFEEAQANAAVAVLVVVVARSVET
jgi:hypothetical protein